MNSKARGKNPLDAIWMPNSGPSWLSTMLIDRPFMKPTRIGLERKSAMAPRRRKLAAMHNSPTSSASIIDSAR